MIDPLTRNKIQMFCVWCGVAFLVVAFIGWIISGFFPPIPPSFSADQIATIYGHDYARIRLGMIIVMLSALLLVAYVVVITEFVARVEGRPGILTFGMFSGGLTLAIETFYCGCWWLTAAFRPERPPELIRLMNDLSFLVFVAGISVWLAWPLAIAVTSFCDKSPEPIFPRWCGWAHVWCALVFLPGQLAFIFTDGVFAWNGLFGLYTPIVVYLVVITGCTTVVLRRAVLRDRARLNDLPVECPSPP